MLMTDGDKWPAHKRTGFWEHAGKFVQRRVKSRHLRSGKILVEVMQPFSYTVFISNVQGLHAGTKWWGPLRGNLCLLKQLKLIIYGHPIY